MQVKGVTAPASQSCSDSMTCCQDSACCCGCHHYAYSMSLNHPLAVLCNICGRYVFSYSNHSQIKSQRADQFHQQHGPVHSMSSVVPCENKGLWLPAAVDRAQTVLSGPAHSHSWHDLQRQAQLASSCCCRRALPSFCTCCRPANTGKLSPCLQLWSPSALHAWLMNEHRWHLTGDLVLE